MNDKAPYVSPKVSSQLKKGQKAINNANQDRIYIITGREGSGKSLLARQLAYDLFPDDFDLSCICFGYKQISDTIRNTNKKVIVCDEVLSGLSSRGALSKENKELIRLFSECRYRKLTIFLCVSSIFMLEKYMAIFRSHGLLHTQIYKRDYTKRFYKVYNYENKKLLYILGQKYMSYNRPKIHLKHRFYGRNPPTISEKEYEAKKTKYFREQEEDVAPESKAMKQRNALFYYLNKHFKMKYTEISDVLKDFECSLHPSIIGENVRKHLERVKSGKDL